MKRIHMRFLPVLFIISLVVAVAGGPPSATAHPEESALDRATKSGVLRVGWGAWFPFLYVDPKTGKMTGWTVDLYENHLGPAMGVKIEWVEQPWSTMMAGLQSGRFDIVSNANRNFKRLLVAEYAGPMTQAGKALMTTKDKISKYNGWRDADNPDTTICVALGTSADVEVTKVFKKAEIMRVEGDPACITALASGRSDIYSTDIGNLEALTLEHKAFRVIPNSAFTKVELGIWVRRGDQATLNWINMFIRDMKLKGVYDDLIAKYELKGVSVVW